MPPECCALVVAAAVALAVGDEGGKHDGTFAMAVDTVGQRAGSGVQVEVEVAEVMDSSTTVSARL